MILLLSACSSDDTKPAGDVLDVTAEVSDGMALDLVEPPAEVTAEVVQEIAAETTVEPTEQMFTFKAIGGASMGANGLRIHALNPELFDVSAALGGYLNPAYLHDMITRQMFGGFCDLATLEANIDQLNDPDAPDLQCGPTVKISPWEFDIDFNHFKSDLSGGSFHRTFIFSAWESLFMAMGNLISYNPDHPVLPPGVPVTWMDKNLALDNCEAPVVVGPPHNSNAEYNPEGAYNLVTFCDGNPPIEGGKDNPDYWDLVGDYDPDFDHTIPVTVALAVDINGNGKRDYHEPVVFNSMERFEDTGKDGCPDDQEDGQGGCAGGGEGDDPNGDNIAIPGNPLGTEGDGFRQEGEDYQDFGLDGVDGTGDYGEGDGEYSMNPNLESAIAKSPPAQFRQYTPEQLHRLTFLMDGGVRDSLHAAAGTYPMAAILADLGEDVGFHDNYSGKPDAVHPTAEPIDFTTDADKVDLSVDAIGKHYMVVYGSLDASQAEIDKGDGKHVGDGFQVVNRLAGMILTSLFRWPDMDWAPCTGAFGKLGSSSFYSPGLQNRYYYSYSLPPCYTSEEYLETTYPVIIFMPGQGTGSEANTGAAVIFNMLSMGGAIPKFIMLAPEGQCCYLRPSENGRYCACKENPDDNSIYDCVDPDCTGDHESCEILPIPKSELTEECNGGHFFSNHKCNRFGSVDNIDQMKYEDMMLEMVEHFDGQFRVRQPAVLPIDG